MLFLPLSTDEGGDCGRAAQTSLYMRITKSLMDVSESVDLERGLRTSFLTDVQVMLKPLVQGPHFENDWFVGRVHIASQILIIELKLHSGQVISPC